jgi:hypothetical protein
LMYYSEFLVHKRYHLSLAPGVGGRAPKWPSIYGVGEF